MNNRTLLVRTLRVLSDELTLALRSFTVARGLEATGLGQVAPGLHAVVVEACREQAVLALSRVLIENEESVTFHYLLNLAQNHPRLFRGAAQAQVQAAVAAHRKILRQYAPLTQAIASRRDKLLAHADRKLVNDPAAIRSLQKIDFQEVEQCLRDLLRIFNVYEAYYRTASLDVEALETQIQGELRLLAGRIGQDDVPAEEDPSRSTR